MKYLQNLFVLLRFSGYLTIDLKAMITFFDQ